MNKQAVDLSTNPSFKILRLLSFNVFPVCAYVDGCGLVDAERERDRERVGST